MQCNGIDVDQFTGWGELIAQRPEAGFAVASVRHRWDDGFAVDGTCETFTEAGQVSERTKHTVRTDWPPPFGADSGPTPGAELLLAAIGACVATTYIAKAAVRGVAVEELEVVTEGRVDLRGLLALDGVPAAFSGITVTIQVRSGADTSVLDDLGKTVISTSPVYDSMATPVAIQLSVQRKA